MRINVGFLVTDIIVASVVASVLRVKGFFSILLTSVGIGLILLSKRTENVVMFHVGTFLFFMGFVPILVEALNLREKVKLFKFDKYVIFMNLDVNAPLVLGFGTSLATLLITLLLRRGLPSF